MILTSGSISNPIFRAVALLTFLSNPGNAQLFNQTDYSSTSAYSWYSDNWYQLGTGFSGTMQSLTIKCYTSPDNANRPTYGEVWLEEFSDSGYGHYTNSWRISASTENNPNSPPLDGAACGPLVADVTFANLNISLTPTSYYRLRTFDPLQNACVFLLGTSTEGIAMFDNFIYGTGRVQYYYTFYPYIVSTGPPLCNSPQSLFVDNSGAAGLVEAFNSPPQFAAGELTTSITLTNPLRFWLGVLDTSITSGVTLAPNLDVGPQGLATELGLVTPCVAGLSGRPPFISCTQPGGAAWTAQFCSPGSITIQLGATPLSAAVTLTDILIPGNPTSLTVTLAQGFERIPDFVTAVQCVTSGGSKAIGCVSSALSNLASNPVEVVQLQQVLAAAGIKLTINQVITAILDSVSLKMIETLGDLVVFGIDTAAAGHYGTATLKISGR